MLTKGSAVLAIVLFIILLLLWRRLHLVQQNRRELHSQTQALLNTIPDGLFLLDRSYHIGTLYSASLEQWFAQRELASASLLDILHTHLPEDLLPLTKDYIDALFMPHVNEKLLNALNPLSEVALYLPDADKRLQTRYVDFIFHRVPTGSATPGQLQVTVTDVSRRVALARALQNSDKRAEKQMSMLVKLLHVEPAMLQDFLQRAERGLQDINRILRSYVSQRSRYQQALSEIFPLMHVIKGDAALLRLDLFELKAHQFEDDVTALQQQRTLSDDDLLSLALDLDQFINDIAAVKTIAGHFQHLNQELLSNNAAKDQLALADIELLIKKLADSQNKQVQFVTLQREIAARLPEAHVLIVRDILVQLARNAVTHGIEAPLERVRQGKDPVGTIQLSFVYQKDRYYQLLLHDDGRGIDASCIRKAALRSGKWNTQQLSARDDSQVLQLLFEPGFSTSEHISTHAGRGIGLEIVKKKLTQLSAELQLATRPGEFCEWRLMVSLLPSKQAGANAARHA